MNPVARSASCDRDFGSVHIKPLSIHCHSNPQKLHRRNGVICGYRNYRIYRNYIGFMRYARFLPNILSMTIATAPSPVTLQAVPKESMAM